MNPSLDAIDQLVLAQLAQVTVVIAGAGLIARLGCGRRPHLAYVLWLVVLAKCLTPPLWSSPTSLFSCATPPVVVPADSASAASTPTMPPTVRPFSAPADQEIASGSKNLRVAPTAEMMSTASPHMVPQWREPVSPLTGRRVARWLWIGWAAGAAVYAGFALLLTIGCWRTIRRSQVPRDESLVALLETLAQRLRVRRKTRLVLVSEPLGPMTFGWLRPAIIVPQALTTGRSAVDLEPLLAHELVHVRRGDAFVGLLQLAAQCLWWFHPLVWWANRQIGRERERCCDEEVIAGLACQPGVYARCLVNVLELKRQLRWPGPLPGLRRFEVTKQRLEHLMWHSAGFRARMPRAYWLLLLAGVLLLVPGARLARSTDEPVATSARTDPPTTRPEAANPQAASPGDEAVAAIALMKGVYDSFAWVDKVRSFHIRTEYKTRPTAEAIRWDKEHRRPIFGGVPHLNPRTFCVDFEWAWDESHIRYSYQNHYDGESTYGRQTRIWDGSLAVQFGERSDHTQKSYVLDNKFSLFFNDQQVTLQLMLPWGPGGPHHFWWLPTDVAKYREGMGVAPKDFVLAGEEPVNGKRCRVLESRIGGYRMHVGVADGRLYRRTWLLPVGTAPAGLPSPKRPKFHETFDDYREVAPGCWIPFRQWVDQFALESPEPFLLSHTEQKVTEVVVDQPLPKDLFHIRLAEGVPVTTDWRYEPPIRYTYHKDQTEAERIALRDAERKKREKGSEDWEKRRTLVNLRIGSAPLPLPNTGWLQGGPLSWEELRGKVVVLHFWSVGCAPCQADLPFLVQWHRELARNNIVVIGIHPPTTDLAAVRKKLAEFNATYPVLVDAPSMKPNGIGVVHDWFGDTWWPNTVLIDKQGLVAAHGQLFMGDIPGKVRELAAAEPPQSGGPGVTPKPAYGSDENANGKASPSPRVIETNPKQGATGVSADLKEIRVTFDRDMGRGMSWTGGPPFFPPVDRSRKARWINPRTCVLPVKLEKGRYYCLGVNSSSHRNFRSARGIAVPPAALYFTTAGATDEVVSRLRVPKIVTLEPANGAADVDPVTAELRVTFDVRMGKGMSWTGSGPGFPKSPAGNQASWSSDGKTCIFPVSLEPGHGYRLGLNSRKFINFESEWGVPLQPFAYQFKTR